jgi:hypothetical protein
MEFDIGDLVEIGSETHYAEVTGVIHDDERLFVLFPDGDNEREFTFGAVVKQWRVVPNATVRG